MGWHDHRGVVKQTGFELKPGMTKEDFNPYLKRVDKSFYTQQCRENELKLYRELNPAKLYLTCRYDSRECGTTNLVLGEHLLEHIAYNQIMRFGQALFVEGLYVSCGYLKEPWCMEKMKDWVSNPPATPKHEIPYR